MRFSYGPHALDNLIERGLDRAWIERTVIDPDDLEPDPNHSDRLRAYRTVPERDGRVLRVIYVFENGGCRIVTAFFDRSRRSRL